MKTRFATLIGGGLALTMAVTTNPSSAQQAAPPPSNRVALVIGEGAYRSGALPAAPNDAGLVAETLAGAGFDVTGARDLDGDGLRGAVRDFLAKAGATGPDGIALVYFAGRALQFDGDNYFEPIDARLARPADVPIETLRLGDLDRALAALPIQAKVVVVDGSYAGQPADVGLPPGLALVEAEQGELLAFNTAPGTVAPKTTGPYGIYAQSFVQAMKQGGAPVEDVFDRLRLSVETATGGAMVPWDSDKLTRSFKFFERAADAPLVESAQIPFSALQKRPLRDFPPDQAYDVAIARDTLPAYSEFLTAFPDNPLVRRVRLLQAIRREALFWSAAVRGGTPPAFWTYLARYPKGPHAVEARRRLSRLAVGSAPPSFAPLVFDIPPPPEAEIVVFDRPIIFDGPDYPPPPQPPVFLLPPPVETALPPPPRPPGPGFLPIPVPVAIPSVRGFGDAGTISPPRTVRGAYPHPRPFVRGPNGEGLVVEDGVPPPGPRQGNALDQVQPVPSPRPLPTAGQRPPAKQLPAAGQLPPAAAGQLAPAGQPGSVSRPAPQPAPPASPATATGRPAAVPAPTTLPGANPLPTPGAPGRTSGPAPRSGEPVPKVGRVNPRGSKPAATDPVSATPAPAQQPAARQPAAAQPAAPGQPAAPAARQGAGPAGNTKRPPGAAPAPVGAAASPAPSKPRAVPGPPPAAAPQRRLAPELRPAPEPRPQPETRPAPAQRALPQPGAPHPAEGPQGEGGPGRKRPACGHPGEPPCHP